MRLLAWRSNSCITLIAGRMPRCGIMSGEYGCLPFIRGLPKTQSSTSEMATVRTQAQPRSQSSSRALSVSLSPDSRRGRFGKDYAGRRICSARRQFARILPSCRRRSYQWYCSEPRSAFNRTVILRCRFFLAENLLHSQKGNDALLSRRASDVCANPYPLRLFADPLGNLIRPSGYCTDKPLSLPHFGA
jgi:hypothetical protein